MMGMTSFLSSSSSCWSARTIVQQACHKYPAAAAATTAVAFSEAATTTTTTTISSSAQSPVMTTSHPLGTRRYHYTYSSPGSYYDTAVANDTTNNNKNTKMDRRQAWLERLWSHRDFDRRGFTVGIGGPVGSGKTALVKELCKILYDNKNTQKENDSTTTTNQKQHHSFNVAVVTNDIFTQEDAEFLIKSKVLPRHRIRAVETGGCPHAAIREDVSANLSALEELTRTIYSVNNNNHYSHDDKSTLSSVKGSSPPLTVPSSATSLGSTGGDHPSQEGHDHDHSHDHHHSNEWHDAVSDRPLLLCESGGDNLAADFSRELADLTVYVIDVAGGDKVPRKGGPGITQADVLIINKCDLADAVGANLDIMKRDADKMRGGTKGALSSTFKAPPTIFAAVKHGQGLPEITKFILSNFHRAMHLHDEKKKKKQKQMI